MKSKEFAEKRRQMAENSIEELIDLLDDENLQTRFLAVDCDYRGGSRGGANHHVLCPSGAHSSRRAAASR